MPLPRQSRLIALLLVCGTLLLGQPVSVAAQTAPAQQPPPPPPKQAAEKTAPAKEKQPDYSGEAFVIEQMKMSYRFEKDGTGQREMNLRAKIQSEAGVEGFGQLVFPYSAGNEKLEIVYVRVRKAGGGVVTASASNVQDLTAPLETGARIYTDLRQKHVTVPGLRPGDVLEYNVVWRLHTPLAPDHFWLEHNFLKDPFIVLDERLEVDVPLESTLKLKAAAGLEGANREQAGRRVYTWKHSNLKRKEPDEAAKKKPDEPRPPDVQMSTFQNWGEVGKWYALLEQDRSVPDEKIRAKVAELIRGREDERAKIEALYEFVAKNFRYVSLSLGQGRYQPHAAADVLANEYGDCKDKHTLLAAMLRAAGLRAYPALIHSARKIDAEIPSPAQFDHVISAIPLGKEMLWVDTTTEVAPFRLLSRQLRDKHALLITGDGPARLETTPADPPFPVTDLLEIEGQVNELGALKGRSRFTLRGDTELLYRLIFRRTPANDWKHLGKFLAASLTHGLEVGEVKPGDPAATEKPFEIEFDFTGASFIDWSSKKASVTLPLPAVELPDADAEKQEETGPIKFDAPAEITHRLKLTLPAAYKARAPLPVTISRDYAEYRSQYKLEGNILTAERTLRLRVRELPAERAQDYLAFVASARADEAQGLAVETGLVAGAPAIPDSLKVDELLTAATAAGDNGNYTLAAALLRRVLEKEPKHKTARRNLGFALLELREHDEAVRVLREQTRLNPFDDYAHHALGLAHWRQQNYADAEAAFRKQLEVTPLNSASLGSLGQLLVERRKYKEAVPELEKAISLESEDETLFVTLGSAYLHLGQQAKATEAYEKALEIASEPNVWNNVAYNYAVAGVELEKARQYAESAVTAVSNELRNVEPGRLTPDDMYNVSSLVAYWDTLGWVYFRQGDLDLAEKYVTAAWLAGQHSENGDHLGQIHEKRGKTEEAARTYAMAAVARNPVPEPRERLEKLVGKERSDVLIAKAKEELAALNTVKVAAQVKDLKEPAAGDFHLVLAPGGASSGAKVVDVKFISGSDKLRPLAGALKGGTYRMVFPDETPTRLIRRGTLSCPPAGGECTFVMKHPDDATSRD